MPLISSIKNFFSTDDSRVIDSELDKLFSFLEKMTKSADSKENYLSQYREIKNESRNNFNKEYIKLYLDWEEFVIDNQPTNSDLSFISKFRERVREEIDIDKLDKDLRIIFVSEKEIAVRLYEDLIQYLAESVILDIGHDTFLSIFRESKNNSIFDSLKTDKNGFDFSKLNMEMIRDNRTFNLAEITRIFKGFISIFYNKIELTMGPDSAKEIFDNFFKEIREKYNTNIASILLRVIPERVLNTDEWLSLLSKRELEREVKLKTKEVEDLNNRLSEKVSERTEELQRAYEELKKLDQKKSEFISVAAHQLRTPLSGIKWTIEMLKNGELGDLNKEQEVFLEKGYKTNENMLAIINDMLNSDLIITGRAEYKFEKTNIKKLIDSSVLQVESVAKAKKIEIVKPKTTVAEDIVADDKKLRLVITNLMDNAVKYSEDNSKVVISLEKDGDNTKLCIKDRGIGIPKEQKDSIFDKFFRAKNAIRTQTNGSGLGLFISKNIIERHGGTIWFENNKTKGTTFCFSIPKNPKDAKKS